MLTRKGTDGGNGDGDSEGNTVGGLRQKIASVDTLIGWLRDVVPGSLSKAIELRATLAARLKKLEERKK